MAIPFELYERLQAAAEDHQRSIRGELRYALTLYLDQTDARRRAAGKAAA